MSHHTRFRNNLALRLLALYLLFVGPILAAAIVFDAQAYRTLRDDVAAADLSLAEAIALETDALLLKAQQAVVEFAEQPYVIAADVEAMELAFGTGAIARQDINLFYRLDADGIMIVHYPTGPKSTVGDDFSFRDYFKAARVSGGPVFSKGRISPTTGRPVATAVMPVYDGQGRFDGVVATNLELQRLTETLVVIGQEQGTERGAQVTIVDAVGQIIAHSNPERLLQTALDDLPGVRKSLAGGRGSLIETDADGREWVYSYAPIPTAGWGVVVQRPTEIAFATSQSFHRGLLIAIGIFAIGASLFWWGLTRRVIRPLEQLTRFSEVIGSQDVQATVSRRDLADVSGLPDQMGLLAQTLLRMEEDVLRRFAELETLLQTSAAVLASLDTQQVMDRILEAVQRLLAVNVCAILVLDQETQQLEVRASRGLSETYVQSLHLDATERQLPAWRAIDSGKVVQVPDVETDSDFASVLPLARAEGYRSLLAVPLTMPHVPPAVLVIYRAEPRPFDKTEIELASSFGNHAAMALENAALFSLTDEELQKQVQSLRALNRTALTVSQSLVLDDVLNNALDAAVQVMETDTAWVYLLAEGETTLRLRAHRGFSAEFALQVAEQEMGVGLDGWVAQTGEPLMIKDVSRSSSHPLPASIEEGLRSFAAVPLRAQENVVGVLGVASRGDRHFTDDEVDLLSAIGGQVGLAVENARLYRRSRQAAILDERNRMAREIHDSLAQGLIGIIVQLEAVDRLAQRRPEQAAQALQHARDLARHSLQEARRSVWGLRPRTLEGQTLVEAIGDHIAATQEQEKESLTIHFSISGEERALSPDVELNLFRITQEALSNVQRHAHAHATHVHLSFESGQVRLVVQDNGVGLVLANLADPSGDGGFGLIGMQERASLLGGEMRVSSITDEGTQIEIIVPG